MAINALTVPCPVCKASKFAPCTDKHKAVRLHSHRERWNLMRVKAMLKKSKAIKRPIDMSRRTTKQKVFKRVNHLGGRTQKAGQKINNHGQFGSAKDEIF